jgi:integrase/recombinase XerD
MSAWATAVNDYLAIRRSLGFRLQGYESYLESFTRFLEEKGALYITSALALEWAQNTSSNRPAEWARRLSRVRGFAQHWTATDPRTEVPPWFLLPFRGGHTRPYLYSSDEIDKLLKAALCLRPKGGLRGWTLFTLLGLLASTGLRLGEAINLQTEDVDLAEGLLIIRQTKFGKSRLVPLHSSALAVLADYAARRDRFLAGRPAVRFFVSRRGRPLDKCVVERNFRELSRGTGLREPSASRGPRLHDFRHRFAIETLLRWYRTGEDIERRLPILSTFLGHVSVRDTYWYLRACPELMGLAISRLEDRWEGRQ